MLYEDPKADPLSEKRFHMEFHFSPGAKTIDEQRKKARMSPVSERKSKGEPDLVSPCEATTTSKPLGTSKDDTRGGFGDAALTPVGESEVLVPSNPARTVTSRIHGKAGVVSSSDVSSSDVDPAPTESFSTADQNEARNSASPASNSPSLEESYDKSFDDVVYEYSRNERPRYSIGIDDFSDGQVPSGSDTTNTSSGMSIEEQSVTPADWPYSKSDTQLISSVLSQDVYSRIQSEDDEMRRLSDSDVTACHVFVNSPPISIPSQGQGDNGCRGKTENVFSVSYPDNSKKRSSSNPGDFDLEERSERLHRRKRHSLSEMEAVPLTDARDVDTAPRESSSHTSVGRGLTICLTTIIYVIEQIYNAT